MRTAIFSAVLGIVALVGCTAAAQSIRAVTQDGKTVILHPNGTWIYADSPQPVASTARRFTKPSTAGGSVTGKRFKYSLWFDESKWRVLDEPDNKSAEYEFRHSTGDGYALIIAERIPIPLENLKAIALENAKKVARDMKIVGEERRSVNGNDVLLLRMEGTTQGIQFIFYGYYYSGRQGTVQLLTWTARQLFDEYRADFDDLLNGFVVN